MFRRRAPSVRHYPMGPSQSIAVGQSVDPASLAPASAGRAVPSVPQAGGDFVCGSHQWTWVKGLVKGLAKGLAKDWASGLGQGTGPGDWARGPATGLGQG